MDWSASDGEGDSLAWEERLWVSEAVKLADLLTFLEEMVMEEKPALFCGMIVVTAELVCMCEGCELLFVLHSGAVALKG